MINHKRKRSVVEIEQVKMNLSKEAIDKIAASIDTFSLNFDLEKICSVSLSPRNVYICLVCGKYFQGRGEGSQAHKHTLQTSHELFMSLSDGSAFILPEGIPFEHEFLVNIRKNLKPTYSESEVDEIDVDKVSRLSLSGIEFIPGLIGLNKTGKSDYMNSLVIALSVVAPLRKKLLLDKFVNEPVLASLSDLFKKMFNKNAFKHTIYPHEFLQTVRVASSNSFFSDANEGSNFLLWLLNQFNIRKNHRIEWCLGQLRVQSTSLDMPGTWKSDHQNIFLLTLELPPLPVIKGKGSFIPSIELTSLMKKFNGEQISEDLTNRLCKKYSFEKLPEYLIIVYKRFVKNDFIQEKNNTVVLSPVEGFDMRPYCALDSDQLATTYDLVSCVIHEGTLKDGSYRTCLKRCDQWYEISDLRVNQIFQQQLAACEPYIQIYRRSSTIIV